MSSKYTVARFFGGGDPNAATTAMLVPNPKGAGETDPGDYGVMPNGTSYQSWDDLLRYGIGRVIDNVTAKNDVVTVRPEYPEAKGSATVPVSSALPNASATFQMTPTIWAVVAVLAVLMLPALRKSV